VRSSAGGGGATPTRPASRYQLRSRSTSSGLRAAIPEGDRARERLLGERHGLAVALGIGAIGRPDGRRHGVEEPGVAARVELAAEEADAVAERVPVRVCDEQRQQPLAPRAPGAGQRQQRAVEARGGEEAPARAGVGGQLVDDEIAPARVHPGDPHGSTRRK
jgi:hypothetical protein